MQRKKELLGEEDPQIAACHMAMGALYESMGKAEEALQCYEVAEVLRSAIADGRNTAYADTLTAIGKLYEGQEAYDEAEHFVRKALEVRKAVAMKKAACISGVCSCWQKSNGGRRISMRQSDIADRRRRLRRNASSRASPLCNGVGKARLMEEAADHLEEAAEAFTRTAEIRKEMLDEDNPLYLGTLEALARYL